MPGPRPHAAQQSSPLTVTCPILRPGRTSLPYRCTFSPGSRGHAVQVRAVDRRCSAPPSTFAIPAGAAPAAPERQVEHGAQVLLELAGHRPSMVQWPLLCGRIASSLTSDAVRRCSNISTASTPVTSELAGDPQRDLLRPPAAWSSAGRAPARSPRGRRRRPAPSPPPASRGLPVRRRATSTASSRVNATFSSASSGAPAAAPARTGASSAADSTEPHALAVVAAARGLQHDRPAAVLGGERGQLARRRRPPPSAGTGRPSAVSRARITILSWACTSASGPGRTATPASASRAQVLGGHVLVVERQHVAARRRTARSVSRSR